MDELRLGERLKLKYDYGTINFVEEGEEFDWRENVIASVYKGDLIRWLSKCEKEI